MIFSASQLINNDAYRIETFIAKGGMAEVWRAERTSNGSTVAIKILTRNSVHNEQLLERFKLEYEMLVKLNHPNIIKVFDFGWHEHQGVRLPWYSMDYLPLTLRQRLPQVSIGEGIRLLLPILDALDFAHGMQICHRDLKPVNILLDNNGESFLTDFGIAKEMDRERNLTGKFIIGTATYISPEQCLGVPVVPASDIYSMGVILYQLATGKYPFEDASEINLIQKHVRENPATLTSLNPAVSARLEEIVLKCLAKKPQDRYQRAKELKRELIGCPEVKQAVDRILKEGELILGNRYRVIGLIEQGGFAEVYRVKEVRSGRVYALKILMPALMFDDESVKRFQREIQILKSLDHPNIIKVVDHGEHQYQVFNLPFFIMPFFPGNLQAALSDAADPDKAMSVVMDVLDALHYAHAPERGICHRDLKPSNVLIDSEGRGYLTDFGIAKVTSQYENIVTRNATMTRAAIGTSVYMSPEQIRNEPVDGRTDLYSIGIMLYEIATGQRPFDARSSELITAMHLYEEPRPPSSINHSLSPRLEAAVMRCLEKIPAKRYGTAGDLAAALRSAQYKGVWFGAQPFFNLNPRTLIFTTARTFKSSAPYLGIAACLFMFLVGMAGAVAYRARTIGLPKSEVVWHPGYYPKPVLDSTRRRMQGLEARFVAMAPRPAAEPAPPSLPPELLELTSDRLFDRYQRLAGIRRNLAGEGDPALATRIDARLEGLLALADLPAVRVSTESRKVVQTNEDSSDYRFVMSASKENFPLEYDYRLFRMHGDERGDLLTEGSTDDPSILIQDLAADGDYLIDINPVFRSAASGMEWTAPVEDYPEGFPFRISKVTKPVRLAAKGDGREWALSNADEFDRWTWVLRPAGPGEEVVIDSSRLVFDDARLASVPEGAYTLECKALDAAGLEYVSPAEEIIIDVTPPTLTIPPAMRQTVLLPTDEPRRIEFTAEDNLRTGLEFHFSEEPGRGDTRKIDNSIAVRWEQPPADVPFGMKSVFITAREPQAMGRQLESAPVELRVFSFAQETASVIEAWKAVEEAIALSPGAYERTDRMVPLGELAGAAASPEKLQAWFADNGVSDESVARLLGICEARESYKRLDDRLNLRLGFFERVLAKSEAAGRDAVRAELAQVRKRWAADTDPEGRPDTYLRPLENQLLPPVTAGADVFAEVPDMANPQNSRVEVRPAFARKYAASYRYAMLTSDPGDADLNDLLEQRGQIVVEDVYIPAGGDELLVPLHLVIQTYLRDTETEAELTSDARKFEIGPLIKLDPALMANLETFVGVLRLSNSDRSHIYERTLTWIRELDIPLTPEGKPDFIEIIRRSSRPGELDKLQSELAKIETYIAADEKFWDIKDSLLANRLRPWDVNERERLEGQIEIEWLSQAASEDPEAFIERNYKAFCSENANHVLPPPAFEGLPTITFTAPGDMTLSTTLLGSIPPASLRFAWGPDGDLPREGDAGWKPLLKGTALALTPPPGSATRHLLCVRREDTETEPAMALRSQWVELAWFEKGPDVDPAAVSAADAQEFLRKKVLPALPGPGAKGDGMFDAYAALFKGGGGNAENSGIIYAYTESRNARPLQAEITSGNYLFRDIEVVGQRGNTFQIRLAAENPTLNKISHGDYIIELAREGGSVVIVKEEKIRR